MHRRIAPPAIILVAFLAITGCGAGAGNTTSATTSAAARPAAAPTATPTPAKSYTNADLTGLISTLKDAQGQPLTVVPAAQIDQGILKAKEVLKTAVFTPEACKAFADSNAQVPDGSTYAAGTSVSAADKMTTVVTVIALKDAQTMTDQLDASQAAAAQCQTFTLEAAGQKITTETKVREPVQPAGSFKRRWNESVPMSSWHFLVRLSLDAAPSRAARPALYVPAILTARLLNLAPGRLPRLRQSDA